MLKYLLTLALLFLHPTFSSLVDQDVAYQQPEQVHLSLGQDATQMIVTWVSFNATDPPTVEYGTEDLSESATGTSTLFVDGGSEKRQLFIHRVMLKNLKPGQRYMYHCGSEFGWSDLFTFRTIREGSDWSPRFAVYGDMGNVNPQSVPRLQEDVAKGMYDAVLHVGDFAYNMDTDNARVGDEFLRQLEPVAGNVPYMTCPGNHEQNYNFSNYNNRFTMMDGRSGQISNLFYSFDIGPAHIVAYTTEFYYYTEYGWDQIQRQYDWLMSDLTEATKPENRQKRPWIITMGHRPLYCCMEHKKYPECDDFQRKIIKNGIRIRNRGPQLYGLEDLFYKFGVDLEFYGHEHNYQRLFPVYKNKVYNGSTEYPYQNPKAPVHIVTGSAGCQERHRQFDPLPSWSAFRNNDYGYTRMTIHNKTHLELEQVSDDQNGKIVDSVMIKKDVHGPEAWL